MSLDVYFPVISSPYSIKYFCVLFIENPKKSNGVSGFSLLEVLCECIYMYLKIE